MKAEFTVRNDDEIKEKLRRSKYNIEEKKDCYKIRWMVKGETKEVKRRFGKGKDKEKAYEKIKN